MNLNSRPLSSVQQRRIFALRLPAASGTALEEFLRVLQQVPTAERRAGERVPRNLNDTRRQGGCGEPPSHRRIAHTSRLKAFGYIALCSILLHRPPFRVLTPETNLLPRVRSQAGSGTTCLE